MRRALIAGLLCLTVAALAGGTARAASPRTIADSGFRPARDGFAFANYGNDAGPVNMTAANLEDLFGPQVCLSGTGATCRLTPSAKFWMDQVNRSMAGGHCMGFSVSALRFFAKNLAPSTFGAPSTIALPVQGNDPLQSLIAEDFAFQDLPSVTNAAVVGPPSRVLSALVAALKDRHEDYTLAIIKPDGSGGHAVTPFAVEDRGGGQETILVYDNNFPKAVRSVSVDTRRETWHYVGGVNPSDANEIYNGDAKTQSMLLLPTKPGETRQPCPFCTAVTPSPSPSTPPSPLDRRKYVEVALDTGQTAHPHLVFTDPQGRRTGYVGRRLLRQIPGIQVVQDYNVRNWRDSREPNFHLPLAHPNYTVTVDGSGLRRSVKAKLTVNGAGLVFYIQDAQMGRGQKDTMLLPAKNLSISYTSRRHFPGTPTIGVQFPQIATQPSRGHRGAVRLITMGTGAIGFAPGSPVSLFISPQSGTAYVASFGARALVSSARYVLSVDSSPVGHGPRERSYLTAKLPIGRGRAQVARFHYLRPSTTHLPVDLQTGSGSHVGSFLVPPS